MVVKNSARPETMTDFEELYKTFPTEVTGAFEKFYNEVKFMWPPPKKLELFAAFTRGWADALTWTNKKELHP